MNDLRMFKAAMALTLVALAGLTIRHNLLQERGDSLAMTDFASPTVVKASRPHPRLTPVDVVSLQLEAIRHNDAGDNGIRTAFRFASPQNRQMTGPVERFIEIVKSPEYEPMFTYAHIEYGPLFLREAVAQQPVALVDAEGGRTYFLFLLSRQEEQPLGRCWMTEGVIRVGPPGAPGQAPEAEDRVRI